MEGLNILQDLYKIIPKENIKIEETMSKHTSFKVGGTADYFITIKSIEQIQKLQKYANTNNINMYIIGNGSNLLVTDKGFRGIIAKIEIDDVDFKEQGENIIATVGAGVKIMTLAQILIKNEIKGFEELSGIPGTIGGANFMNAGAHGKEMKDIITETKVLNKQNGKIEILKNKQQNLVYRGSIFKSGQYIILETTMQLQKGKKEEIEKKVLEYFNQRKEKQPIEYPSAGSTFKRGKDFITAQLIDRCGLKGYSIGGAQISEKHAGFIINRGNATAKDITDLIEYTKKKVFEKFGVQIEEEVQIIGD